MQSNLLTTSPADVPQPAKNPSHIKAQDPGDCRIEKSCGLSSASACAEQTKSAPPESSIPPAVAEYRDFPERPVKLIASKHGLPAAALIHQARKAQLPGRKRGRRYQIQPSAEQRKMIEMYRTKTGRLIAQEFGISPQRVYQILRRWKHLLPERSCTTWAVDTQPPIRRERERKETIVSFRLTKRQIDRVKELLRGLSVSPHVSDSKACHVVFVAMIGGYSDSATSKNIMLGKGVPS